MNIVLCSNIDDRNILVLLSGVRLNFHPYNLPV